MSLFGQLPGASSSGAGGAGTGLGGGGGGGGGLFGSLSVNTSAGTGTGTGTGTGIGMGTGSPLSGFGTPASNEKRKSIFDASTSRSLPTAQPPSLFGAANPMATTSSIPSLNVPAPTTATTFSFKPTTTTSSSAAPSMFSGLNTNTSAPAAGGMFGAAPPPTTSAAGGSMFSAAQPPTTSAPSINPFGASTLGASTTSNIFGNTTTTQPGESPSIFKDKAPRDGGYFSSLLERQKKKAKLHNPAQTSTSSRLPTLNMDLGDLARRAQDFSQKDNTPNSRPMDSRAHYLLAGSGVKPGKAYRDFQGLENNDVPFDLNPPPADPVVDTDEYIKNLRTKGRDVVMRESMERVYREVDSYIEQTLGIDFEQQKLRIMKHFGLMPEDDQSNPKQSGGGGSGGPPRNDSSFGGTRSAFGRSGLNKSIIGTPGSAVGTSSFFRSDNDSSQSKPLMRGQSARDLRDKERLFMDKVQALNQARLRQGNYQIMQEFSVVEETAGGDSPHQLKDAYLGLRNITRENGTPSTARERQFAALYAEGPPAAVEMKKRILDGSRTYLEESCYREIESVVDKNPREAKLGGRPTVVNKVRAYIRVRASRRDLAPEGTELQQIGDSEDFCWILIFYLLRCGFVDEAAEYVNSDAAFQSTDRRFVSYMSAYANSHDRRLSRKLQDMIEGEYQQRTKLAPKGTVDPYRMACYKVVGRCELQSKTIEIGTSMEDWLWLQFALARESTGDPDPCGLEQIQDLVNEIGEKHFQRGQTEASAGYGTFFLLQMLAGMFEKAIDFLHPINPVSAVHFAIALSYYGLLRVADHNVAGNKLLDITTTNLPAINLVPLIAHYTGTFRTALPIAAVDYLTLICLNSDLRPPALGQTQTRTCHECLRELCLETREFAKLLGDIRSDGSRIPGAIEQRARIIKIENRDEFLKAITTQSAAVADQRGQIADAVLLYHLCEDYDNVISVLNRSLADAIGLDLGESPLELQPLKPLEDPTGVSAGSQQNAPVSSLSLTQSTSSPVELAKNMITLYNDNAAYYNTITSTNRESCGALLRMLSARAHLEANPPRYMTALEELNDLGILPLSANGNIPSIRNAATAFGSMPQLLARCAGISVVWAVRAIGGERDKIVRQGSWETGYGGDRDALKNQLGSMAKDLMVFAGLVKYKLPARVYDLLTRAGGDVGGY